MKIQSLGSGTEEHRVLSSSVVSMEIFVCDLWFTKAINEV